MSSMPFYGRILNSFVQTSLVICLVGVYLQAVIPVPGLTIPAFWVFPAFTIWNPFDISFVTSCITPQEMQGLNPFSDDDTITTCNIPWSYQTMIFGSFLGAIGHLINDAIYKAFKSAEHNTLASLSSSPASSILNDPTASNDLSVIDEQVDIWHQNAAASLETLSLGSTTGLIAALSAPDWGVEGEIIFVMRFIVQIMIMSNYLIQGISAISPLLAVLGIIWTYIFDIQMIWAWLCFIWSWTFGLLWWVITFIWARLCCIESIITCQCCASNTQTYTSVPEHDKL